MVTDPDQVQRKLMAVALGTQLPFFLCVAAGILLGPLYLWLLLAFIPGTACHAAMVRYVQLRRGIPQSWGTAGVVGALYTGALLAVVWMMFGAFD